MLNSLPNLLTISRILAIPAICAAFYLPGAWSAWLPLGLFAAAGITDWFDGYLARKWNQTSAFGAFLDPVADKLMVAAALILLAELDRAPAWLIFIIIGREITISALREWMAQLGKSKSVAVNMIGKLKTTAQMVAIGFLLFYMPLPGLHWLPIPLIGTLALYLAGILTIVSMFYYLRVAAQQFKEIP